MSGMDTGMDTGMEVDALAEAVIGRVPDGIEAQVVAGRTRHGLTRFANSVIHQHVGEETTSLHLQVALDGKVASAESTRLDDEGRRRLVQDAVEMARLRPVDPHWPGLSGPASIDGRGNHDPATGTLPHTDRAGAAAAFIDEGDGLAGAGFADADVDEIAYANTAGNRLSGTRTRATIDGIHQTPTSAGKGHATAWRFADIDPAGAGARAARLARSSADPEDVEPGDYEVVLAPECVGSMVTFLAFYGFNAKSVLDGESFVELGDDQFDAAVTLRDDARDDRAIGVPFDVQGVPRRPLSLVAAGVSSALVHDRRTAARMQVESTGHAIPGGEVWGALPTNLFLAAGDRSPGSLVGDVDRGLLVTEFNYCRILDPKTQVVTGLTRNGTFLIEDGEVTRPVTNLRFTQSFVEALGPGRVLGVGDDARFADAEFGIGMVHAPSLRLAAFSFTGGAQG